LRGRRMLDTPNEVSEAIVLERLLKTGAFDDAQQQIQQMREQQLYIAPFALTQFFRLACEAERVNECLNVLEDTVELTSSAVFLMFDHCFKRSDVELARRVERLARRSRVRFLGGAYEVLLRIYISAGDKCALDIFDEFQASGLQLTEATCVALLARCAETKFLSLADKIAEHLEAQGTLCMAAFCARMKVYASCGLYEKACDLYDQIVDAGLEPDGTMYGCLIRFSVECGRIELAHQLFDKAPTLEIQNYMSLIRAAGRERNVEMAFDVMQKLKISGLPVDLAVYNCLLNVCVSVGEMKRAVGLMQDMRAIGALDVITYNTLLKGYANIGDLVGARRVIKDMIHDGHQPNDISFNCLINAAVCVGNVAEAWEIVNEMEACGVGVDNYTISIMMKALKRVRNPSTATKVLALLDVRKQDFLHDEVLLNSVLETCVRVQEYERLEKLTLQVQEAKLRLSVHTYGSLIKACSCLKRVDRCWLFWNEMIDGCALRPNDLALGCMLDALVRNNEVEEAMSLMRLWQERVPPNTIMYSTLIKGFANSRQSKRAMELWEEMSAAGVVMNTVVYNGLIDAQARVGATDEVARLMESMEADGCEKDGITYSTVVKCFCIQGDLDKAFEVFRSMQRHHMVVNSIIYNTLLDGCARQGRTDLSEELMRDMEAHDIPATSFTLSILVRSYGRSNQLDKAVEIFNTLPKKHHFVVNAQARTCFMTVCLNHNAVEMAFEIFQQMKRSGPVPDARAYGAMISGCVRCARFTEAVVLVEEALGLAPHPRVAFPLGQTLDPQFIEQLLRGLAHHGLMDSVGVPLLEKLRAAHVLPQGVRVSYFETAS